MMRLRGGRQGEHGRTGVLPTSSATELAYDIVAMGIVTALSTDNERIECRRLGEIFFKSETFFA